jgi:hypothetical protein
MQLEENHALFGLDATPRIVAVELLGDDQVAVYRRSEDGAGTVVEHAALVPFLWLAGEQAGIASEPLAGGCRTTGSSIARAGRILAGCVRNCATAG